MSENFEADEDTEPLLLEAIAECERGETVPWETLMQDLRLPQCDDCAVDAQTAPARADSISLGSSIVRNHEDG